MSVEDVYSRGDDFMLIGKNGTEEEPGAEEILIKKETQKTFNEDVIDKLIKASNKIDKASRSGCGNFIIASPKVCESLNELAERQEIIAKRKALNNKLQKIKK